MTSSHNLESCRTNPRQTGILHRITAVLCSECGALRGDTASLARAALQGSGIRRKGAKNFGN
jgi:hypothetical protein